VTSLRRTEWWREAFKRPYLECYAHRDDGAADRESKFVAKLLGLRADARLLDAGCGAGRHVRAFCRRGAKVVGVDFSKDLLDEARRRGKEPYVQADVRALPFRDAAFAHVVSLFTSFGYFDGDGDKRHLRELRRVLRPGGTFVIDFLNPGRVRHDLVRQGGVVKPVPIRHPVGHGPTVWIESVRLYGRKDLEKLLSAAGFDVRSVHGDLAGGVWEEDAQRLVLTAAAA
jgi:ubiquinone/menaquinone biosynthesis C-methylase UbiE